jgi:hypothetical protein
MSDIKGLREISNDPFGKLLTALSKKFSEFLARDQAELVENPEDVYSDGQDVESALKYHSFAMSKRFDLTTDYYSPSEPDQDKLRLWLKGNAIGVQLKDWSELEKAAYLYGDPILVDGAPFDYGITDGALNTKSIALRVNRPTSPLVNDEYIQISDAPSLQVSGMTVGISYFMRFKIHSLSTQGGLERTLFEKIDGVTIQDAVLALVTTDGRLKFYVRRSGMDYKWQTAINTIATDTVYEVWFTFSQSGPIAHIFVNNVDKSLTTPSAPPVFQSETDNYDLWLFQRGKGPEEGFFYGDFYDFMLFREKVVTSTEVARHYINKWTLADIDFGHVLISNYSATFAGETELVTRISKSMTYKWNVAVTGLTRISKSMTAKWDVIGFVPPVMAESYTPLSYTETSYTTVGLTRVSLSMRYKYNVVGRVSKSRIYKWNIVVSGGGGPSFTSTSFTTTSFTS